LDVFAEAGGMPPLRAKSEALTGYLDYLLRAECGDRIAVLTPPEPRRRGCQLSLGVRSDRLPGRELHPRLEAAGGACGWRHRGGLNRCLLDVAEAAGVTIHFQQNCRDVDLDRRTLSLLDEATGRLHAVPFERALGTDGSASRVREAVLRATGGHAREELLDHG